MLKVDDCRIAIHRVHGAAENEAIVVEIEDEAARVIVARASMSLAEFVRVVTGSSASCSLDFNDSGRVGTTYEVRKVEIAVTKGPWNTSLDEAKALLAPYHVDGWRGDPRALLNQHNYAMGKKICTMWLRRNVRADGSAVE